MIVQFNECLSGPDVFYRPNKDYDLDDDTARKYIAAGLCRAVTPKPAKGPAVETADRKPKVETADAKPVRKRGA